jgi:histidinol-phosphatase
MDIQEQSPELETALQAATLAGNIIRKHFRGNFTVTTKKDQTPVTQVDIECEDAIRQIILARFPEHGFYGEETGTIRGDAECLWLVDPIDGTKSFVRQYPFFSTQIALMRRGEIVLGVSNGVMFDELAWAERGKGAWLNGDALHVSDVSEISRATLSAGNIKSLASGNAWRRYGDLVRAVNRIRGYGDFYHYHLLATGKIDAVIESDVNILDIAALSIIVAEAGGIFTDLNGQPVGLDTTSVLASNANLRAELLQRLES